MGGVETGTCSPPWCFDCSRAQDGTLALGSWSRFQIWSKFGEVLDQNLADLNL